MFYRRRLRIIYFVFSYEFLVTGSRNLQEVTTYSVEFNVNTNHHLVVDVIDYNPDTSLENVTVYDSRRSSITESTRRFK